MNKKLFVLLVEDNEDLIYLFKEVFEGKGHTVAVARSIAEVVKVYQDPIDDQRFIYALVDIHLGSSRDNAGILILKLIHEIASHRTLACAMTGDATEQTIRAATQVGARIVFPKPIDLDVVRIQFEETDLEEVITKASHNQLTGLLNYDRFEEMLLVDINLALEDRYPGSNKSFSLLSIDADDFGSINKLYSHRTGDLAIKAIGRILEKRLRLGDWICHKSGDEFLIWLRNTKIQTAIGIAANLEDAVAAAEVRHSDGQLIPIRISIGVTGVDMEQMRHLTNSEKVPHIMEQAEMGSHGLNKVKEKRKGERRRHNT
ncbi:MAG: diguanylate cyclase [Patescibacteria group bacterium]